MEKQTIFIKHSITDENSLPKVEGQYHVYDNFIKAEKMLFYDFNWKQSWLDYVDWWLEEKEVPNDDEIEETSRKFTSPLIWKSGIHWFKSKLGIK